MGILPLIELRSAGRYAGAPSLVDLQASAPAKKHRLVRMRCLPTALWRPVRPARNSAHPASRAAGEEDNAFAGEWGGPGGGPAPGGGISVQSTAAAKPTLPQARRPAPAKRARPRPHGST